MPTAYETDPYAWAQEQAMMLRAGLVTELDLFHLAEELDDMGQSRRDALSSRLIVLLAHLLKLAYATQHLPTDLARAARGWRTTCRTQRLHLARLLRRNPSLRPLVPEELAEAYPIARIEAAEGLAIAEAVLPATCPWSVAQILDDAFWPEG